MASNGGGILGRVKALPSTAWHLVLLGTFVAVANGIYGFAFVLFLLKLGHDTSVQGILISVMEVTVALTIMPFGMLAPKVGKRRMLFAGLAATALSYIFVALATELWQFVPGMLLLGLGTSLITPTLAAALADTVCDSDRKYLMSFNAFCAMLASAVGYFLSGLLVQLVGEENGFRAVFGIAGGMVFLSAFLLTRRIDGACAPVQQMKGQSRKILPFVLPQLFLGLGAGLVIPFFPVYFKLRFNTSTGLISTVFTVTQLFWAAAYIAMPVVAERKGSVRTLIFMQAAAVVALFSIPLTIDFQSTAVLYAVRMILMNASRPLADSYMMTLVGKDLRSTAVAANQLAWMLPHMVSVAVGGLLMASNQELPFFICGILYIISTTFYAYFFMGRDDVEKERERGAGSRDGMGSG